jgi:hypothetical protein
MVVNYLIEFFKNIFEFLKCLIVYLRNILSTKKITTITKKTSRPPTAAYSNGDDAGIQCVLLAALSICSRVVDGTDGVVVDH